MEAESQVRHEPCPECRSNGKDNSGRAVAAGVYWVRQTTDQVVRSRSMVLAK